MTNTDPIDKLVIGCGYLGLRSARAWIQQGQKVAALTRSAQRARQLADQGVVAIVGDVMDRASLRHLPAATTILYAVGFDRDAGYSKHDVYVNGLQQVLDRLLAMQHGVPRSRLQRFLYISSTSVYGQTAGEQITEESPCGPTTDGGKTCLEAEQRVRDAFGGSLSDDPAGAIILRLAGIYGPGRLLRRIEAVQSGDPVSGNPAAWLNLIHVDDAVRAVLATDSNTHVGETFLVADGHPLSRRDYYRELAGLLGGNDPEFTDDTTDLNKQVRNAKLMNLLDGPLLYPTARSGLRDALRGIADGL